MDSNRKHVREWLEKNLELSFFTIEEMPLFPGGVIVYDQTGQKMLVYWDFLYQKIKVEYS